MLSLPPSSSRTLAIDSSLAQSLSRISDSLLSIINTPDLFAARFSANGLRNMDLDRSLGGVRVADFLITSLLACSIPVKLVYGIEGQRITVMAARRFSASVTNAVGYGIISVFGKPLVVIDLSSRYYHWSVSAPSLHPSN
ncbi:uncharacterized protein EV420DRAFT_1523897 [Desarmillaria tabescens]|uniref:Uncharacterized protein n=1 Tax=Armillaria tabescens TaxID=1929756 RepID=A0AA39NAY1_ARMTA|nr:uncharacterized protein EV420DRAFT_1523897 [Desarmillaria tabescens]KAK0462275.1 hypothetical protein EV420DRAFT_1523897 [Desarmillaria tabescens]